MVCRIQYSGRALALVAALAAATFVVIACTPGGPWLRILAVAWTSCAALAAARRLGTRGRRATRVLVVRPGGEVRVQDGRGAWQGGSLREGSFVAPWLTIVRWRPEGERFDRSVLLLAGMADAQALRRLRVLLRWGGAHASARPGAALSCGSLCPPRTGEKS